MQTEALSQTIYLLEWTPGKWWIARQTGEDGSYTPLYEGQGHKQRERQEDAREWGAKLIACGPAAQDVASGLCPTVLYRDTYKMHEELARLGLMIPRYGGGYAANKCLAYIVDHGEFKTKNTWFTLDTAPRMEELP